MCGQSADDGSGALGLKPIRQMGGGSEAVTCQPKTCKRASGGVEWRSSRQASRSAPIGDKWTKQVSPFLAVLTQICGGLIERAVHQYGFATIAGVGERNRGMGPLEAVVIERQRREERRTDPQRVYRAAHVVQDSRLCELLGSCPATDGGPPLDDLYGLAGLGERDGGRQAVGTGADDDCVKHEVRLGRSALCSRWAVNAWAQPEAGRRGASPLFGTSRLEMGATARGTLI